MKIIASKCISLLLIVSISNVYAAHKNTLKVKNKTGQPIEFKVHTTTGSQATIIETKKSTHFPLDMSTLEGFDWQIASPQNPKCKDWYRLDKKALVVTSLRKQGKDSVLTIEENGTFQSVTGKSIQRVENMEPFTKVCGKE